MMDPEIEAMFGSVITVEQARDELFKAYAAASQPLANPWRKPSPRSERPDIEGPDAGGYLEKSSGDRKRLVLTQWLLEKLALGQDLEQIIEFAAERDPATANLLRECAARL